MKKYLTLDVGGTFVKSALMDARGELLCRFEKVPTEKKSQRGFVELLKRRIGSANAYALAQGQEEIAGVAISAPGRIDSENGIMNTGGAIFAIDHLPVKALLEETFQIPVTVENDARCAALAESWQGALQGCRMGVAFIIGTAIGGGIVYQGQVLHGTHLLAGEFSYLMTNAADWAQRHQLLAEQGGVPALIETAAQMTGEQAERLSGEMIFQQAEQGNSRYRAAIEAYAERIAVQLCNLQVVLDPDRIAIGGGISEQPLLLTLLREATARLHRVYPHELPLPQLVACRFHNDANLMGALCHHLTQTQQKQEEN